MLLFVVATLALIFMPAIGHHTRMDPMISCQNNLKLIGLSFDVYAGDNNGKYPAYSDKTSNQERAAAQESLPTIYRLLSFSISSPKYLYCPSDVRTGASTFEGMQLSNLSYFASLTAARTLSNAVLCGDRNITLDGFQIRTGRCELFATTYLSWTKDMHSKSSRFECGNLLLSDGSVYACKTNASYLVSNQHLLTNILLVP